MRIFYEGKPAELAGRALTACALIRRVRLL
jgi:hypothetical protein